MTVLSKDAPTDSNVYTYNKNTTNYNKVVFLTHWLVFSMNDLRKLERDPGYRIWMRSLSLGMGEIATIMDDMDKRSKSTLWMAIIKACASIIHEKQTCLTSDEAAILYLFAHGSVFLQMFHKASGQAHAELFIQHAS